jgi:hypothetical protein
MKTFFTFIVGLAISLIPVVSFAALDWHIRWDEANSAQIARVYIFNPETTMQTFTLEIGDVAKTAEDDPYAPHLIIGQDVSLNAIAPSERKIFDIVVYRDIDTSDTLTTASDAHASQIFFEKHEEELKILRDRYGRSESRDYPVALGIQPVVREEPRENRAIYKSQRGYWIVTLVDHDHITEQLIRTGERMEASYASIQDAIFYYTQGRQLTGDALDVWETAFPELKIVDTQPTPYPYGDCMYFVTVLTNNLSYYSSSRALTIGDVLVSNDPMLSSVVVAEDVSFSVAPNTPNSKRLVRVYLMSQGGKPSEQSEYVSVITHHAQIEQAIRIGYAESYHPCAIQDVIFYINHEVPALTIGQGLWDRLGGTQPAPVPTPGQRSTCLGDPTTQPDAAGQPSQSSGQTSYCFTRQTTPINTQIEAMTFKNLVVLVGAVVPFSLLFRRNRRK